MTVAAKANVLMTYETTSGPLSGPGLALPGNGKLQMNSICIGFAVDGKGLFI